MKTGIELIAQERAEQIEKHGRTLLDDVVNNQHGELAQVAKYLCTKYSPEQEYPRNWSQEFKFRIDRNKTQKQRLIIAAALLAAEIDRLNALGL